jgi:hypothetical protein
MKKLLLLFLLLPTLCFAQLKTDPIIEATATKVKVDILSTSTISLGTERDEIKFIPNKLVSVDTSNLSDVKTYIEPKIVFSKWKDKNGIPEETLTLEIPSDIGFTDKTVDSVTGEVKMSNGKESFYFRQHDADTLKFGLILNEIPDKSKVVSIDGVEYYQWQFKLVGWENFDFLYQTPWINYEEVYFTADKSPFNIEGIHYQKTDEPHIGSIRLPKTQGSYAIYHKTKKNYCIGQIDYGCGKFGDYTSPRFLSVTGDYVWGKIIIQDGITTELCPKEFLDKATLPVKSNAEFGYTTKGGTAGDSQSGRATSYGATTLTETGTITSIDIWVYNSTAGSSNIATALYTNSSGVPGALLVSSGSVAVASAYNNWKSCSVSDIQRTTGNFHLAFMVNESTILTFYYDYTGSDTMNIDTGLTFPTFADPFSSVYSDATKFSIKATYTAGGGAATGSVLNNCVINNALIR